MLHFMTVYNTNLVKQKYERKRADARREARQKKNKAECFPINPKGLERIVRVEIGEGKNGGIIQWVLPNTNTVIFEWDEGLQKGSHYHALLPEDYNKHNDIHYEPGSPIPEPWNSLYF